MPDDLVTINIIYNYYVEHTTSTFDLTTWPMKKRHEWFSHYQVTGPHRLLVATRNQKILGYATSSQLRPKAAYDTSVETSIYLAPDQVGKGIGSRLYQMLFDCLAKEDLHRAYAGITLPNPASMYLHQSFGFNLIGTWHEAGRKFDRYHSVQWFEKKLGQDEKTRSANNIPAKLSEIQPDPTLL